MPTARTGKLTLADDKLAAAHQGIGRVWTSGAILAGRSGADVVPERSSGTSGGDKTTLDCTDKSFPHVADPAGCGGGNAPQSAACADEQRLPVWPAETDICHLVHGNGNEFQQFSFG